ncbi:hypothetical protein [Plantactinospora sp. CA-290183]|uniref:hypothetical protein n=1 Tax=Plantactinospora sp. CA-290183 TaxID=3240006 RepID=UPI003D908048
MSIFDHIDRALAGLCPCGAPPAEGSAYCSDDCRPARPGLDDERHLRGAMRWRPAPVAADDDPDRTDPATPGTALPGAAAPVPASRRDAHAFPWRRACWRCGRHGVPLAGERVVPGPARSSTPDAATGPDTGGTEPCQLCEHCRTPFPGPVLTPVVEQHGRHTVLRLSYLRGGERYTRSAFVTGRDLAAAEDPSSLLQASWDRLEAFLFDRIAAPRNPPPHPRPGHP